MNGKRRAGHVHSPELSTPDPPQKRIRKRNDDTHFPEVETVESTQELGEKIISLLKRSQDKNGRLIATEFISLPDRSLYPDYYEHTALPMSINVIDAKLKRGEYGNMTALESDLKRMVQNAKDYNDSKSEVFEDAERIRKALSNFMPKHNPAYQDPDYRAVPTPIPDHVTRMKMRDSSASGSEQGTIKLRLSTGGKLRSAAPSEPVENGSVDEEMSQTQLDLLDELSAQEDAINFEEKPPRRDYPDYYRIIKQPTSINNVRILVKQEKIRSWDDFARELRLIWTNAKEYNEPSSDIYVITERLEAWLEGKLKSQGVRPKIVQRLSLKTPQPPPQLKLKLGKPLAPAVNGNHYTVDEAALARQNREMASALDRARGDSEAASTPAPTVHSSVRRSVSVADPDVPMTGVNGHTSAQVDSTKAIVPPGPSNIPTPTLEGEPPGQDLKSGLHSSTGALTNGYHQPALPQQPGSTQPLFTESTNPIDRKFRESHKSALDALLPSITYMTNPLMPNDPKWALTRYASPTKTQTSYYTYLPSTHSSIRIIPSLHSDLRSGNKRKHKMFVLNNGATLPASPDFRAEQTDQAAGVYDCHLVPGENVVVVECIAAMPEGERREGAKEWEQFEFERVTFYIYLRPKGS